VTCLKIGTNLVLFCFIGDLLEIDTNLVLFCFTGDLVEINTNLVLFCFFKPAQDFPSQERCLILKFLHTRLLTQSEQFANELTRHLDICAPNCRILRQKVRLMPMTAANEANSIAPLFFKYVSSPRVRYVQS